MALTFADFRLERATFELRYPEALLIWDRAGDIGHRLKRKFPKLRPRSAQPNIQLLALQDDVFVETRLDRLIITAYQLKNQIDTIANICDDVSDIVISALDLTDLERIGFRMFFQKQFASHEQCSEFMISSFPALGRNGKYFNIEGSASDPEFALRWEGKATGCLVKVYVAEQKLEINAPPEFLGNDLPSYKNDFVMLDVDCYVHVTTAISKFNAKALLEGWTKLVRRDVEGFING